MQGAIDTSASVSKLLDMVCVGVDGCPHGWVVARDDGRPPYVVRTVAEALDGDVVLVDIPYGLVDAPQRPADLAARRFLAKFGKNSSVFPSPGIAVLYIESYVEANNVSKTRYDKGLTKQTFELRHKIREGEALATLANLYEGHPEVSFAVMSGQRLRPKRTPQGQEERKALLRHHLGAADFQPPSARRPTTSSTPSPSSGPPDGWRTVYTAPFPTHLSSCRMAARAR